MEILTQCIFSLRYDSKYSALSGRHVEQWELSSKRMISFDFVRSIGSRADPTRPEPSTRQDADMARRLTKVRISLSVWLLLLPGGSTHAFNHSVSDYHVRVQELADFEKNSPDWCTVGAVDDDLMHWNAMLAGPVRRMRVDILCVCTY